MQTMATRLGVLALGMIGISLSYAGAADPEITIQAVAGKPYGVGKAVFHWATRPATKQTTTAEVEFGRSDAMNTPHANFEEWSNIRLRDPSGRALYPAFSEKRRNGVNYAFQYTDWRDTANGVDRTILFLFRGDEPLNITLSGLPDKAVDRTFTVPVGKDANQRAVMLDEWWHGYQVNQDSIGWGDYYQPLVENYLAGMLARKLNLKLDEHYVHHRRGEMEEVFGLLLGAESVRLAMQQDMLLKTDGKADKADQPMPKALVPEAVAIPPFPADVAVEPISLRIPPECFYVRCGSYANFQWVRSMGDEWISKIRDAVAFRGLDFDIRARLERQIVMKETALGKLLGSTVIADVALLGTDTFFREGSSFGIMFQAKSSQMLSAQIARLRKEALVADKAVTETTVVLAGKNVSLLSRPDNAVRSFYVVDGDYHLVTNSRKIAQRFLEVSAAEKTSLGASQEFRYARHLMPLKRNDSLFLYMSDAFFRELVGVQYRVEMTRRMQSLVEMDLVQLARLAARAEGVAAASIEQLVKEKFLPEGIGQRCDGSTLVEKDGVLSDSLRGGRGSFLPVADVEIAGLTIAEANAYEQFATAYRRAWERMDPVAVGIHREDRGNGTQEWISADVYISPYAKAVYGRIARYLGTPAKRQMIPAGGDVVFLEAIVNSAMIGKEFGREADEGSRDSNNPQRLFAGLRAFEIPFTISAGQVHVTEPKKASDMVKMYAGEGPAMLLANFVLSGRRNAADAEAGLPPEGMIEAWGEKIFYKKAAPYLVMSFDPTTLNVAAKQLRQQDAARAAQVRLWIMNPGASVFAPILNAAGFTHMRHVSAGNAFFLSMLERQLHVPPAEALKVGQGILGARMVCPLGGTYELNSNGAWISTAWNPVSMRDVTSVPGGYVYPLLDWVQELNVEFAVDGAVLTAHVELLVKKKM